ncbi:MAG: hypothetical protein VW268_10670 [Rhodospirillaceae bacterium]
MDLIYFIFSAVLLIAGALGAIAIWAPRRTWVRFAAVGAVMLFIPVAYVHAVELLSKPKPIEYAWFERTRDKAIVLGIDFDEGNSIYLWLRLAGSNEPRYFAIPWSLPLAQRLQDGLEDAVKRNSVLVITNPFIKPGPDDWGDLNVQIKPPPAPPMKKPQIPPRIIDPREFKI